MESHAFAWLSLCAYSNDLMERKIISRRVERRRPDKLKRVLSLVDFYEKRNKILINRSVGGLGDVLMNRMMFEDIKLLMPDCEIHYACPIQYHDAVRDHPYIDKLLDPAHVDRKDYIAYYNTTTACGRTEMQFAPLSAPNNRSDIWASHCGFELTRHNMHFQITDEENKDNFYYKCIKNDVEIELTDSCKQFERDYKQG